MEPRKKILSRVEWFFLIVSLAMLTIAVLRSCGVDMVEREETIEWTRGNGTAERAGDRARLERLEQLANEPVAPRVSTEPETDRGFRWSRLKIEPDEKKYLTDKYGAAAVEGSPNDWFATISQSYQTYKNVKEALHELGVDTDELLNAQNAGRVLSNPVLSRSFYDKLERDFGIPAERSRAFADQNQQNLERWADFVEREASRLERREK